MTCPFEKADAHVGKHKLREFAFRDMANTYMAFCKAYSLIR